MCRQRAGIDAIIRSYSMDGSKIAETWRFPYEKFARFSLRGEKQFYENMFGERDIKITLLENVRDYETFQKWIRKGSAS